MTTTVIAEPRVNLWFPDIGMTPRTCQFRYEPRDPYAVTLTVNNDQGVLGTWTFDRTLLADGLTGHAGQGDVRIWPVGDSDSPTLAMVLASFGGTVHLYAPLEPIAVFVDSMHKVVAPGTEYTQDDVDAELESLLRDADD
jgi:hypothetical protein